MNKFAVLRNPKKPPYCPQKEGRAREKHLPKGERRNRQKNLLIARHKGGYKHSYETGRGKKKELEKREKGKGAQGARLRRR